MKSNILMPGAILLVLFSYLLAFGAKQTSPAVEPANHEHATKDPKKETHDDHGNEHEDEHGHEDEDEHEHGNEDSDHSEEDGEHAHGEEKGHAEHGKGEKGHEEEEAPKNVGPTKGILSYSEKKGFVLSPEAYKNFEIELKTIGEGKAWVLPKSVLVLTGDEKNVYRFRDGAFKRIDIEVQSKSMDSVTLSSKSLRSGDQVASKGAGFLRVAEVDLTSGDSGHHH